MSAASSDSSSPLPRGVRRFLSLLAEPVILFMRRRTIRRSAKWNVDTARRWRRKRPGVTVFEIVSYLGAAALGVVVVWSLIVMLSGPGILKSLNDRCDRYSAACGAAVGFLIPLLSVALASAIFLFYRLRFVKSPVVKKAKNSPGELVETAPRNIGTIVGRDELCQVIMEDIRHRDIRRPHLVVGGVGTGKTAVLVRLTKLLADRGAIPVPIRLRDAQDDLNFRDMASERFEDMTEGRLLSRGEAEKVWRQLSKDDKIVVLADGLEEALIEGSAARDRDNRIRIAIRRARESGVPLIIASRPHDPLRGADATIMELEPLSEDAALEYIDPGNNSDDARRLEWIVEAAGLTELPLYLQITRELSRANRLDHVAAGGTAKVDTRSHDRDRSQLRVRLLETWMEALFDGHLMPAVPLKRAEREAAVEWLSALACLGLKADTIDVKFEDYYPADKAPGEPKADPPLKYKNIDKKIQSTLQELLPRRRLDIRLAVTWGDQLGLVEANGDGLRFPHSIMQAYLGSRFVCSALKDEQFRKEAKVALVEPGREFLIALVLYSRSKAADRTEPAGTQPDEASAPSPSAAAPGERAAGPPRPSRRNRWRSRPTADAPAATALTATASSPARPQVRADGQAPAVRAPGTGQTPAEPGPALRSDVGSIRDVLLHSAGKASADVKKLDLYAAALEIDSFLEHPCHDRIAGSVAKSWADIRGGDPRTLDEAKLGLVFRFGEAARAITGRRGRGNSSLHPPLPEPAYRELLEMGASELSYPIRLAIAQEIGAGGDEAFRILHEPTGHPAVDAWTKAAWPAKSAKKARRLSRDQGNETSRRPEGVDQPGNSDQPEAEDQNLTLRRRSLCAWLTPLLAGSVDAHRKEARAELGLWLDRVGRDDGGRDEDDFPLSLEVALAQGFKYAANRRHPHVRQETSFYLAEQAIEMLQKARFWFSQLTLIHALCLWEMPEPAGQHRHGAAARSDGVSGARHQAHRHGSNPEALVGRWREAAANKDHPFVVAACNLAVQALKTSQPERFLWIDESGIVSKVGSRAARASSHRRHYRLWIPPSAGWAALDPRAQQLVADVLLVLNLAERGDEPEQIEQRLTRVGGSDLPPCLTHNRAPLNPRRTVGGLYTAPGTNCVDECPFGLCPYPPKGVQTYRSELGEAFCRGQQTLLSRGLTAPWQSILRADLKGFWADMADRARGGAADEDGD